MSEQQQQPQGLGEAKRRLSDYIKAAFPDSNLDVDEIAAEVKANSARLNGCPKPHEFEPAEYYRNTDLVRKHRCKKCGGTVDNHAKYWYTLGLLDGQKLVGEQPAGDTGGSLPNAPPAQ
jgi:hypothetical protein